MGQSGTTDAAEVEYFSGLAQEWWKPDGELKALHKFNPVRLQYIRDHVAAHFGRNPRLAKPLSGLRLLDIGCGGGILSDPMTRLGADVVGADASDRSIRIAGAHAAESGRHID